MKKIVPVLASFVMIVSGVMPSFAGPPAGCAPASVETSVSRGTPYSMKMAQRARQPVSPGVVYVMGDSMAYRWPQAEIEKIFGTASENFGVGGDRIENTIWLLDQMAGSASPSIRILFFIGTNNVRTDSDCDFAVKLTKLAEVTRKEFPKAVVYLVNLPPKGKGGAAFVARILSENEIYRDIAAKNGFTLVDAHAWIDEACDHYACEFLDVDGVHLSPAGYRLLSDKLAALPEDRNGSGRRNTSDEGEKHAN